MTALTEADMTADEALAGPIVISLREARLVVERILLLSPLEPGLVPDVRDAVLYSQTLQLGGFGALLDGYAGVASNAPPELTRMDHVTCHGAHAWSVTPGLADLAVECGFSGGGILLVEDVTEAAELAIVPALAARHGVTADVVPAGTSTAEIQVRPASLPPPPSQMDALMWRMVRDGFPVLGSLWWRLYHLSNEALAPDSPVSRRHAGHLIVHADGSVTGRRDVDDDTDIHLFRAP